MRVLGIDPGFGRNGFAVLEKKTDSTIDLLFSECFETSKHDPFFDRLHAVCAQFRKHIRRFQPECIALEKLIFSKNKKTVMHVSELRGAIILVSREENLPIIEYGPSTIKVTVTGNGRARKEDITRMIHRLIRIEQKKEYDDEYDAIAIGLTHLFASRGTLPYAP